MNEEEPINEYKESRKLRFNLTGKPILGAPTVDEIRNRIKKICDDIDEWLANENK